MKLQDVYTNTTTITQCGLHVEPNALMSLQNVVKNGGKRRNTFELIVIARFLQLLKDGKFGLEANPVFTASISTSQELLVLLRAMSDDELAKTAASVLQMVAYTGNVTQCCNPAADYVSWLTQFYQAREATD